MELIRAVNVLGIIFPSMTQARLRTHWSGTPSLTDRWIGALLRAFAMLVLCSASFLRMRFGLLSRECHTDVEPDALPELKSGIVKETDKAARRSHRVSRATTIPPTATTIPFALQLDEATTTIFDGLPDDDDFRQGAGRRFQSAVDDDDSNLRTSATILGVGLVSGPWTDIVHA